MAQAIKGNSVNVHYTGKLEDGTVFDSSTDREPLQFTIGEGQVIPGFEQGVIGMNSDETRTVTIPADEAYGQHREELVTVIDRNHLPPDMEIKIGHQLQARQADNQSYVVTVTDIAGSNVTLDANHPLAGKALTFDIQLVEIT